MCIPMVCLNHLMACRYRGDSGAPGVYSNGDTGLWFAPNIDSPRQVTVCTAFASTDEAAAFLDAAIAAVGG